MEFYIILGVVLFIIFALFIGLIIAFNLTFYVGKRDVIDPDNLILPNGGNFERFREEISNWIK